MKEGYDFKPLEGKDVCLLPKRYNVRLLGGDKIIKARIDKVSRVNVTLTMDGRNSTRLRVSGSGRPELTEQDGGQAFRVFVNEQAVLDHHESVAIAKAISNKFQSANYLEQFHPDILKNVASLLHIDLDDMAEN